MKKSKLKNEIEACFKLMDKTKPSVYFGKTSHVIRIKKDLCDDLFEKLGKLNRKIIGSK